MPRDSNGTYNLPAGNPVVTGTVIESTWANTTLNDVAGALTGSISADGSTDPINNLPMAGWRHTGASDATGKNQYVTLGQAQDGRVEKVTLSSASGTNLTGTMAGAPIAYSNGMTVSWTQPANNTGDVSLAIGTLPAKTVVDGFGNMLPANALVANNTYLAYYSAGKFFLISSVSTGASDHLDASAVSGWTRPSSGVYPSITLPSSTTVGIPAGTGYINTPGANSIMTSVQVSWDAQTLPLIYVASGSFITTLLVNSDGSIRQEPGIASPDLLRTCILLGQVTHISGAATHAITSPAIYNSDTYLARDTTYILGNQLAIGGRVTGNATVPLRLDVAQGAIFMAGAQRDSSTSPNFHITSEQVGVQFRALAGDSTLGAVIQSAPLTNYDPGAAGVVTALTGAANATIHRLYWIGGYYIWAYGQTEYASVAEAISYITLDRSTYQPASSLRGGVLICEIIARKDATDFVTPGTTAIISSAGQQYLFGSSQSINEAPAGPLVYGRNATSGWVATMSASTPNVTGNVVITKAQPRVVENCDPNSAGWAGLQIQDTGNNWFNIEATIPDDSVYFRSYNPSGGALRYSTEYDLSTGVWNFPVAPTIAGVAIGDVSGPATATTVGTIALWADTTGNTLAMGADPGDVITKNIQTSPTDSTANRVMMTGAFGLGGTAALKIPVGTTAQRPGAPAAGDTRFNSTLSLIEYYNGTEWVNSANAIANLNYLGGLRLSNNATLSNVLDISAGTATNLTNDQYGTIATAMGKNLTASWAEGGTPAAPLGGRASSVAVSGTQIYSVFIVMKTTGEADIGFDTDINAVNLLADTTPAGYVRKRRIGYIRSVAGVITQFTQAGDVFTFDSPISNVSASSLDYILATTSAPPNTVGIFAYSLLQTSTNSYTIHGKLSSVNTPASITDKSISVIRYASSAAYGNVIQNCLVDNSSRVHAILSVGAHPNTTQQSILTLGWIDNRGQ